MPETYQTTHLALYELTRIMVSESDLDNNLQSFKITQPLAEYLGYTWELDFYKNNIKNPRQLTLIQCMEERNPEWVSCQKTKLKKLSQIYLNKVASLEKEQKNFTIFENQANFASGSALRERENLKERIYKRLLQSHREDLNAIAQEAFRKKYTKKVDLDLDLTYAKDLVSSVKRITLSSKGRVIVKV